MKGLKWIAVLWAGVCALSLLGGCGVQGKEDPADASRQQSGAERNEAVYEGSLLSGIVSDCAEGEFSVLAVQEETDDQGGAIAIMPASGSGKEDQTTKVVYSEDCGFQRVRIDGSREKAPEYQEAGAEDVKKLTEVIVFGEKLPSGEVRADRVLIPQIYNKDKMPGSY